MNFRSRPLLDLSRGAPCQLRIAGVCNNDPATTVACHSNWMEFGKGMSIKASDAVHCHGCSACHAWLDQGQASGAERLLAFLIGVARTMNYLLTEQLVVVAGSKAKEDKPFTRLPKVVARDAYRTRGY